MRILAFDTSGNACSAAVWRDGSVAARRREAMDRGHTEALMPMVLGTLQDAECRFADLDWLAVTIGPGSFTGIRAGLAAAQGITLARALPALGIDTFATVLWSVARALPAGADDRLRVIALDSRREEIYVRIFSPSGEPLTEPDMATPDDLSSRLADRPVVLAGSAARGMEPVFRRAGVDVVMAPDGEAPDAGDLAGLAAERVTARNAGDAVPRLAPLYLHPPYAVRPAGGGRLRP